MKATVILSPAASKRLIAKGTAALPMVRTAHENGRIVIALGTTNAFVAEELTGEPVDRGAFAAGFIDAQWNVNARLGEAGEIFLENGRAVQRSPEEVLSSLRAGDVIIKGGNAIDPWGTVGVLMASATGGTVGRYIPSALARGIDLVVPISISKSVHTPIGELSQDMGTGRIARSQGQACGIFPLNGRVVTELDALDVLFGVDAVHVASNGVGAGHGSVSLLIAGEDRSVERAFELIESLSDEPDIELQGRA